MLDEYYFNNLDRINKLLEKSNYAYTAKALFRFYNKMESISNVIQNIDNNANSYTTLILLRSQIEHFILILYLWLKFIIEEDDKTAEEYYTIYVFAELLKKVGYNESNKISHSSIYAQAVSKAIAKLKSKGVNMKPFNKVIRGFTDQFEVKNISHFITEKMPDDITPFFKKDRIKDLLEQFNYLSSNIHGGPSADIFYFEGGSDQILELAEEYKDWSKGLLTVVRFYIIYFLSYENEDIKLEMQAELGK